MTSTTDKQTTRQTGQRRAIFQALAKDKTALTAQELHQHLTGVGLATVYRNLQRLAEQGKVDTIRRPNGELAFRVCGVGHHHHLICRSCGRVVEVHDCALEDWSRKLATEHDFSAIEHQTELFGTCGACANKTA